MRAAWGGAAALVLCATAAAGAPGQVSAEAAQALPRYGDVIPLPASVAEEKGMFTLSPETAVRVGRGGAQVVESARWFASLLRQATGYSLPVVERSRGATAESIVLSLGGDHAVLGDEGYELRVTPTTVTLRAARAAGVFHGLQTLRQLLPAAVESAGPGGGPWRIRAGVIRDRPRFGWRGAMLDVGRHFFGVADVKRYLDLMAVYKLNRLHLHLADDQGWRIAIRSWPRLTTIGGRTAVGGGPGGFYTQKQYAELVAYADARFITVVPEIDMPGHVNAALASYPSLTCDGQAPPPYTGIEVGFSSLCIRKELTYRFVDDVVRELAALTSGPYVHVGGDEALATDPGDYRFFVKRIQRIVHAHGKRMVGWEETARTRLSKTSLVQHWQSPELARAAVARGVGLILSPAGKAYLDMQYGPESRIGLHWAGYTDVRDAYAWDPATQVEGVDEHDVLGVEAPLWTETATTMADLEYLAFPRLIGIAEIAWSPRAGRSWAMYRHRLARHAPRLRAFEVGFYADPAVPWPAVSPDR